jgi:regulator of protease activity HflC (stomatin/prohibitin superfamily)
MMTMLVTSVRVVPEHRRLAVHRLGRYIGERGPGLVFLLPFIDRATVIDIRDQVATAQASQQMFGAIGETKTLVHDDGSVEIDGKMWNAISSQSIPPGIRVRVKKVILEVETIL